MNFAQMLDYGPRLIAKEAPKPRNTAHLSGDSMTRYREASDGDIVYSTLVAPRLGIDVKSAKSYLRNLFKSGVLEVIGEAPGSSRRKPVLYRWRDGCS